MTSEEEEERKRQIKRLLDSEAETRPEPPVDPDSNAPVDPAGTTRAQAPKINPTYPQYNIPLDKDNMPLPRHVNEVDMEGTRVTPVAYEQNNRPRNGAPANASQVPPPPLNPPIQRSTQPPPPYRPRTTGWRPEYNGCLVRAVIVAVFSAVVLLLMGGSVLLFSYYSIARTLPSVADLQNRASQFETTRILDRNGNVLYEILDPSAGRRTYVPLDKIAPALIAATIATEDKDFYSHPGFDPSAILRALWENYRTNGQGGGASTITQQLARALLLSPEERAERSYSRKAREIILAAEITRRYSKDQILELYLNEIYYGNLAYGIEAASETYFGKAANQLSLSEAAFLAGLPQSPSVYDIYTNRDVTLARQQQVLVLMYGLSQTEGCIKVSTSEVPICVDEVAAANAANEMKARVFNSPNVNTKYPHWVNFVREQLEKQYDPQTIYRSGFNVYTTLDPTMQDEAQRLPDQRRARRACRRKRPARGARFRLDHPCLPGRVRDRAAALRAPVVDASACHDYPAQRRADRPAHRGTKDRGEHRAPAARRSPARARRSDRRVLI